MIDVLDARSLAHPTRIERAQLEGGRILIETSGYRWWDDSSEENGQLLLVFEGVAAGQFDAPLLAGDGDEEALDILCLQWLAEEPWSLSGPVYSFYCQEALPEPLSLHALVADFLSLQSAPRDAFEYLNGGPTIASFQRMTSNADYLLARVPAAMHDLIADEVKRQNVHHVSIVHQYPEATGLFVRFGDSRFSCAEAWAEWDSAVVE